MNAFSRVCVIKGAAYFNDKIDGESINSGSVFIEESLDESTGRARGVRTVEYRTPDSELPSALVKAELPGQFEVGFEIVTTKRGQSIRVVSAKAIKGPVPQPQPMPKAA